MKISFLFLSFLLFNHLCFGQQSSLAQQMNELVDNPVSLSTGTPNIDIPLFNIEIGGQTVPIALSYIARGVRFNQSSGEVGLGWSLSPNYRVNEDIRGHVSNENGVPNLDSIELVLNNNYFWSRDETLAKFASSNDRGGLPSIIDLNNERYSGEHNIYRYSLQDRSGACLWIKKGETLLLDAPKGSVDFKHTYDPYNISLAAYTIYDDRGWKYTFGENEIGENNGDGNSYPVNRILAPNGEAVDFEYVNYFESSTPMFKSELKIIEGYMNGGFNCLTTYNYDTLTTSIDPNAFFSRRVTKITHNRGHLDYIRSPEGKIQSITSYNMAGQQNKQIDFYYSNHDSYVFLDSISVNGLDRVYRFEYYQKKEEYSPGNTKYDITTNKFTLTHWGHYSENEDGHGRGDIPYIGGEEIYDINDHGAISNPYKTIGEMIGPGIESNFSSRWGTALEVFTLKKIIYPGGGSTNYVFIGVENGNGLLIDEIINEDGINGVASRKKYTYKDVFYQFENPDKRYIQQKAIIGGIFSQSTFSITKWALFNTYIITNGVPYLNHEPYYFLNVEEQNFDPEGLTGKTEYLYSSSNYNYIKEFGTNMTPNVALRGQMSRRYPATYRNDEYMGRKPVLEQKIYYKNEGGWKKVRDEVSTYQWFQDPISPTVRNFTVQQYAKMGGWPTDSYSTNHLFEEHLWSEGHIDSFFDYGFYNTITGWPKLLTTKITEYHE